MVRRSEHHRAIIEGVEPLNDGVDDTLQLAQLVPVVTDLGDSVHLINEQHGFARRHEVEDAADILAVSPKSEEITESSRTV